MPASDHIIRLNTGRSRTSLCRSTISRKIAEGTFPPRSGPASTARDGMNPKSIAASPWHGGRRESAAMDDDASRSDREGPANDNRAPYGQESEGKAKASGKLDAAVITIARMIGRQMAREHFDALQAGNDNRSRGAADDD